MSDNKLNIETIRKGNNSMSFCPKRGGIVTSIVLNGVEILYLDQATFEDRTQNVKGGIPIMFPNAGALPEGVIIPAELKDLKQHGFARQSDRWCGVNNDHIYFEELVHDTESLKAFPFRFKLGLYGEVIETGACLIDTDIWNPDVHRFLPVSMGLHPYFKVPSGTKKDIAFEFAGGDAVKDATETWANGKAVSIANPGRMKLRIPGHGTLILYASPEYQRIWVWSMPDRDFVCIEPVMRDKGGIISDPVRIGPNGACSMRFRVDFKPE